MMVGLCALKNTLFLFIHLSTPTDSQNHSKTAPKDRSRVAVSKRVIEICVHLFRDEMKRDYWIGSAEEKKRIRRELTS
jgi:hypothetical protein